MVFDSAQRVKKQGKEPEGVHFLGRRRGCVIFLLGILISGSECVLECIMHCFGYNLRTVRFVYDLSRRIRACEGMVQWRTVHNFC